MSRSGQFSVFIISTGVTHAHTYQHTHTNTHMSCCPISDTSHMSLQRMDKRNKSRQPHSQYIPSLLAMVIVQLHGNHRINWSSLAAFSSGIEATRAILNLWANLWRSLPSWEAYKISADVTSSSGTHWALHTGSKCLSSSTLVSSGQLITVT